MHMLCWYCIEMLVDAICTAASLLSEHKHMAHRYALMFVSALIAHAHVKVGSMPVVRNSNSAERFDDIPKRPAFVCI